MDIIMVCARCGREAGMHLRGYLPYFVYGDIAGQDAVQAIYQLVGFHRDAVCIEVGCHVSGMYAGIGSSCSHHLHLLSQKYGEGALQLLLYRIGIGLNLPAVIVGAVVTEEYEISHDDL